MSVSRGPIREALSQLEREGVVIKYPNRGTFVARLSPEDAEEVYSLRLALERLAIVWAIRHVEPGDLEQMQATVNQMAELAQPEIVQREVAQVDLAFHELLCKASHHTRLYDGWRTLRPQVHILLLSRNIVYAEFLREAVPSHQAIVDAILAGNEQHAVSVIEEHLLGGYRRAITAYSKQEFQETGLGLLVGKRR
jgi:DNA-binding GntR family transcriptional regulator